MKSKLSSVISWPGANGFHRCLVDSVLHLHDRQVKFLGKRFEKNSNYRCTVGDELFPSQLKLLLR